MVRRWLALVWTVLHSLVGARREAEIKSRRYVIIARFDEITTDPPLMHWAPCHPSVVARFKASMTCPNGHGLTLGGHTVATDGFVSPSVICPVRGCHFHEFIRLERWSFGEIR